MRFLRSVAPMRFAKIGYIVISVLLCVPGILLIVIPDFSVSALGIFCGIVLILFGIVRLAGYFSKDLYRLAFQYDLAFGILMIALGVIMTLKTDRLMIFICIALGLSFFTDSIFKIRIAKDSKAFGLGRWWVILLFALVTGVFSVILMFQSGAGGRVLRVFFGIALLAEGILNFSTAVTAVKIIKHQRPDSLDNDYINYEEGEE